MIERPAPAGSGAAQWLFTAIRRRRSRGGWQTWLGLVVLLVGFVGPIVMLIVNSVTDSAAASVTGPLTADHYWSFLSEPVYIRVLVRSAIVAAVVALGTAIIGLPVAWYLVNRTGFLANILLFSLLAPLLAGGVVVSFGWLTLMIRGGSVQQGFELLPFVEEGPVLFHTTAGMMIALIHFLMPFMVISLTSTLERLDWDAIKAARSLGAGPWAVVTRVLIPMSVPGLVGGMTLVFTLAMSAFAVPFFVGGPQTLVLSTLSYQQNARLANYSFGAAVAVILVSVSAVAAVLLRRAASWINPMALRSRRAISR